MNQDDCISDWRFFLQSSSLFFCEHKKHNNYLCNFPPSWYLSTLPCQKITLKHFFFVFFLTQKQSSITPSSALRGLLQTYKISLRFFLFLFLFCLSLSKCKSVQGEKDSKEGRKGAMFGDSPFHSIQRSWTLEACKATKTKHNTDPFLLHATCHCAFKDFSFFTSVHPNVSLYICLVCTSICV